MTHTIHHLRPIQLWQLRGEYKDKIKSNWLPICHDNWRELIRQIDVILFEK